MRIYNKFLITGFIILSLTLWSCQESFLDVAPYGSLNQSVLANENGASGLLIGAYANLANGNYLVGIGRLRGSDEVRQGTETGASVFDAYMYSINEGDINSLWVLNYTGVNRCNAVLQLLKLIKGGNPENLKQIESEAKFLRAHYYFELVRFFRNVPWVDENVNYNDRNYYVPNTVDIYPNIEADLKFAADNLTETKSQVGRANKWAAKSLLGKVYIFQQKYSEAKTVLGDVIANGKTSNGLKYGLQKEYNLNFIQRGKHSVEAVFVMQNDISDLARSGNGNPRDQYNGTFGGPATCCFGWGQPTYDFVDAHQTDPVTGLPLIYTYYLTPLPHDNGLESSAPFTPYMGTLDSRLDWSVGRRGIPYRDWGLHPGKAWVRNQFNSGPYNVIKNIVEQATKARDQGVGGEANNPYNIIRFADVLLWAAECEVEVGSLAKAEEYVNMVRARAANPVSWVRKYINNSQPLAGFSDQPAANYKVGLYNGHFNANGKTYARKAVQFERRLELGQEWHRFFDLVRYDKGKLDYDIVAGLNGFLQREGPRLSNKNNDYLKGVFARNKYEYFPIPVTQIDLSVVDGKSVLVQNPGWQ